MLRYSFLCAALAVYVGVALPAQAAPPQTVTGHGLLGEGFAASGGFAGTRGTLTVTTNCNPQGNSTISYHATGPALGPYPGTFEESGTFTIGPQTLPSPHPGFSNGTLIDFHATFTIDSPLGQVSGEKEAVFSSPTADQLCATAPQSVANFGNLCRSRVPGSTQELVKFARGSAGTAYAATITTPDGGSYTDTGIAGTGLGDTELTCATAAGTVTLQGASFFEQFVARTTPGHANGGGQLEDGTNFAFEAKSDRGGVKGHCVVQAATGAVFRCLDVAVYVQTGNQATFYGNGELDGVPCTYRITVADNEAASLPDAFSISTMCGYADGGPVVEGNVVVHE
jgi:hypothetical protein